MDEQWQQIEALEGFTTFTFERGRFVAASKWNGMSHVWHIFRRLDDGSLEKLNGVWSQLATSSDVANVPQGLGWAEDQISKAG